MNTIKINNIIYKLPENPVHLKSCLNHIDMVIKGVKQFVRLYNLENEEQKITTFELQGAKIEKKIY